MITIGIIIIAAITGFFAGYVVPRKSENEELYRKLYYREMQENIKLQKKVWGEK